MLETETPSAESGTMQLQREPVALTDVVARAVDLYRDVAGPLSDGSVRAVVTMLQDRADDAFAEAAGPGLRVVSNVAVGYDNIDVPALRARDVVVTNTPGVLTDATADLTFGLLLAVTRRLGEADSYYWRVTQWLFPWFTLIPPFGEHIGNPASVCFEKRLN